MLIAHCHEPHTAWTILAALGVLLGPWVIYFRALKAKIKAKRRK